MTISKDALVTADGGLYTRESGYVYWKVGSPKITLDGDFTIAELQWLIDYMSSVQSGSTVEEGK